MIGSEYVGNVNKIIVKFIDMGSRVKGPGEFFSKAVARLLGTRLYSLETCCVSRCAWIWTLFWGVLKQKKKDQLVMLLHH